MTVAEATAGFAELIDEVRVIAGIAATEALEQKEIVAPPTALATAEAELYDAVAAKLRAAFPDPEPSACKRGCNACCHLPVMTDWPTAHRIAGHVRAAWTDDSLHLLWRDIEAYRAAADRHHPCPFLRGGACSIYALRPLACREINSSDLSACRRAARGEVAKSDIPGWPLAPYIAQAIDDSFQATLAARNLPKGRVPLVAALADLLKRHNVLFFDDHRASA